MASTTFPNDFLASIEAALGPEYPDFLAALNEPAPVSLRLNPAKPIPRFSNAAPVPWHPEGRYLEERPSFTLDPSFHAGAYYVQEASSMFLLEVLRQTVDLGSKLKVLDLCAAPGGKSTLLLSAISPDSFLLANEVIQSRVGALRTNLEKWGHANYAVSNHDPADFGGLQGFFDLVVVDAPCSGEGLFRKDENARMEWSKKNVSLCAARQSRILLEAKNLLAPGGILVFSTCTFNDLENEQNLAALLEGGEFEYCKIQLDETFGIREKSLGYQCYPHRVKGEGFFIAALRKTGQGQAETQKTATPRDWSPLPAKQVEPLRPWLADPYQFAFFTKPTGEVHLVQANLLPEFSRVAFALKRRSFGHLVGTLKHLELVPSHNLALGNFLSQDLPSVSLSNTEALLFLKKENIWQPEWPKGWVLAQYEGLHLGWMKVLENRTNNYLPNDWRIRMDIPR